MPEVEHSSIDVRRSHLPGPRKVMKGGSYRLSLRRPCAADDGVFDDNLLTVKPLT